MKGLASEVGLALKRILAGQAAERVVDRVLRDHRGWSRDQRRAVVEAIFNTSLWRVRLAFLLDDPDPPAPRLLFALLNGLVGMSEARAQSLAGLRDSLPLRTDPPPTLAALASLPGWLATHFESELGEEAEAFSLHLNVPGPVTLRVNAPRAERESLASRLRGEGIETEPGRFSPDALHVQGRANLYGSPSLREGLFDVQDEGSQLLGLLVGARPGESVLDYCAGAGGKTLLLGARMRNEGALYAYDPDSERLDRLMQRTSRAGLLNVRVLRERPGPSLQVDRVLVDAPCSELGSLRRGPDLRFRLRPDVLERFVPVQREILEQASSVVRPGGTLVYATCTVNRRENLGVVSSFLADHPEFSLVPVCSREIDPSCVEGAFLVTLPHRQGTDGFFGAVMVRQG